MSTHIDLVTLLVREYDPAVAFFVKALEVLAFRSPLRRVFAVPPKWALTPGRAPAQVAVVPR